MNRIHPALVMDVTLIAIVMAIAEWMAVTRDIVADRGLIDAVQTIPL